MSAQESVIELLRYAKRQHFVYHMKGLEGIDGDGTRVVTQPLGSVGKPGVTKHLTGLGIDCSHLVHRYLLSLGLDHSYLPTASMVESGKLTEAALAMLQTIDRDNVAAGDLVHFNGHIGIVLKWNRGTGVGRIVQAGVKSQISEQPFSIKDGFFGNPIQAFSRPRSDVVTFESIDRAAAELLKLEAAGNVALAKHATDDATAFVKARLEVSASAFARVDSPNVGGEGLAPVRQSWLGRTWSAITSTVSATLSVFRSTRPIDEGAYPSERDLAAEIQLGFGLESMTEEERTRANGPEAAYDWLLNFLTNGGAKLPSGSTFRRPNLGHNDDRRERERDRNDEDAERRRRDAKARNDALDRDDAKSRHADRMEEERRDRDQLERHEREERERRERDAEYRERKRQDAQARYVRDVADRDAARARDEKARDERQQHEQADRDRVERQRQEHDRQQRQRDLDRQNEIAKGWGHKKT